MIDVKVDITANRVASKYSRKELALRVLWGLGKVVFKFSPRPCFGFRRFLLRCFGAKVGRGVHVYPSACIYFPWNLRIEDDASIGECALVYNLGPINIGARTTVSQRVHLCAGTHDYTQNSMPLLKPPIEIESDVWICTDAFIGPNVRIGNSVIVAARAVVVKDVGCGQIVAGNPAVCKKMRN